MVDQEALMQTLSDFTRTLVSEYSVGDVLQELVERVPGVLGISRAGVSLAGGGRLGFATAIDESASMLEQVQEQHQQGPCVEAHEHGQAVLVADLGDDSGRWPALAGAARSVGVVAAAGIPMHLGEIKLGALNLYAAERREWSDEDVRVARLLADMATAYLVNASMLEKSRRLAEQLQEALDSRMVIEQAKGLLAGERKLSLDAAFELLRGHARGHSSSVRAVADAVVRLGLRP
jgi:GAF domain-containing protein